MAPKRRVCKVVMDDENPYHHSVKQIHRLACRNKYSTMKVGAPEIFSDDECRPSVPLQGLKPILLSEMKADDCYTGRVFYGIVKTAPKRIDGLSGTLMILLADDNGDKARLELHHVVLSGSSAAEMNSLYPKGAKMAIKEPCLERYGGKVHIDVYNPANAEIVSCFPERLDTLETMDTNILRAEGNQEIAKQNFAAALELYSMSIKAAEKVDDKCALLLAYSNRAECYLSLEKFHRALGDAEMALSIDTHHTKTLYRKGRALHGMQLYKVAVETYKLALKQKPIAYSQHRELYACMEKSLALDRHSQTGEYDLSEYLKSGEKSEAPELGDYVGPVEIRRSKDEHGMGLFASRDVEAGEVVLISNAIGYLPIDGDSDSFGMILSMADVEIKVFRAVMNSPKVMQQLYSLYDKLYGNSDVAEVPPMALFQPNEEFTCLEIDQQLQMGKILSIRNHNLDRGILEGVWVLPGFINHSCIGNLLQIKVGAARIFRANRPIHAGEELTYCYVPPFLPFDNRQNTQCGGCECKRCLLEMSHKEALDRITKEFVGTYEKFIEVGKKDIATHVKLASLVVVLENMLAAGELRSLSAEDKSLIRAAYAPCYQLYYNYEHYVEKYAVVPPVEVFLDALMLCAPGSMMTMEILVGCFFKLLLDGSLALQFALNVCCTLRYGKQEVEADSALLRALVSPQVPFGMREY